jgi:hypothetical protein
VKCAWPGNCIKLAPEIPRDHGDLLHRRRSLRDRRAGAKAALRYTSFDPKEGSSDGHLS